MLVNEWCNLIHDRLKAGDKNAVWELLIKSDGTRSPFGDLVFRLARGKYGAKLGDDFFDDAVLTAQDICQKILNGRSIRHLKSYVLTAIKRKWIDYLNEESEHIRYPSTSYSNDKKEFEAKMAAIYGDDPRRPQFPRPKSTSFDDRGYWGENPSSSSSEDRAWRRGGARSDLTTEEILNNDSSGGSGFGRMPARNRWRFTNYNAMDAWIDNPEKAYLEAVFQDMEYDPDMPQDLVGVILALFCETEEEKYVFTLHSAGLSLQEISDYSQWGTSRSKAHRIVHEVIDRVAKGNTVKYPKTLRALIGEESPPEQLVITLADEPPVANSEFSAAV